jgi:dolichol-phosphate mannosyltransferase
VFHPDGHFGEQPELDTVQEEVRVNARDHREPSVNGRDAPDGSTDVVGGPASAQPSLARVVDLAPVSVVVPTYREVENIGPLLARFERLRGEVGLELEVIFVDDASDDGSVEAVDAAGHAWARMIVRRDRRGLASAVLDGFRVARHPVLVCMDGDLSHPPEVIPALVLGLQAGSEMVIGSRYVRGGSTDDDWGFGRWLNSRIATLLARPLTSVRDPMAGCFALRRSDFEAAARLDPVGYKVALELIVKCGFERVGEVPIHFRDRVHGESKLTLTRQWQYIRHLRRLYFHRFGNAMDLVQYVTIGATGLAVALVAITVLVAMGGGGVAAFAAAIGLGTLANILLHRRFVFRDGRGRSSRTQISGFLVASVAAAATGVVVATWLHRQGSLGGSRHLAVIAGVMAGAVFSMLGHRYLVFRRTVVRAGPRPFGGD